MDLSAYLKKNSANSKYGLNAKERHCRQCGCLLEDKAHFLYARGFCSEQCNARYVGK